MNSNQLRQSFKFFTAFVVLAFTSFAHASYILSFESAPGSWVGGGKSFTVTPDDGYTFSSNNTVYWDKSLHLLIAGHNSAYGSGSDPTSNDAYHYWTLELSDPYDAALSVGLYENAARWPFQGVGQPGLTFSGDHRGNNLNSGFFNILDIGFNDLGLLTRLAVDFTQYGETNPDWWLTGSLRFNSDVPLPVSVTEPASLILAMMGMLGLITSRKFVRKNLAK